MYSAVIASEFGITLPRPMPVIARITASEVSDVAWLVARLPSAKISSEIRMVGLRPNRSASGVQARAPAMLPNEPAPNARPKAPACRCRSAVMRGARKPSAMVSSPSRNMASAQSPSTSQ